MKISFAGILTIVFIVLKLTGVIGWSWIWVLSPIWIPVILAVVSFLGMAVICKIAIKKEED